MGNPNNYKKLVENPEDIVQDENPKIFMTMHMGCVDVMLFLISEKNKGINILYTPAKNKNIEKATKKADPKRAQNLFLLICPELNHCFLNLIKKKIL